MSKEIWKDISGYEGAYQVSNHARVRTLTRISTGKLGRPRRVDGRILHARLNWCDYLQVDLYKNGKLKRAKLHRLIAEAFIPNPDKLETVNHINGLKTDNRIENLEWCTRSYNLSHAFKIGKYDKRIQSHGSKVRGELSGTSKLTEESVIRIRQLHSDGVCSYEIAKKFGVDYSNVRLIVNRKSWKHVA